MKGLSFVLLGLFAFQSSTFAEAIISDPLIAAPKVPLTYTTISAAYCADQDNNFKVAASGLMYCWKGNPQSQSQENEWEIIQKANEAAKKACCKNKGVRKLIIDCSFDADKPDFRYFDCA